MKQEATRLWTRVAEATRPLQPPETDRRLVLDRVVAAVEDARAAGLASAEMSHVRGLALTALSSGERDGCCGGGLISDEQAAMFGAGLYAGERDELPDTALTASLGCGNPTAMADLRDGMTVLDLGSGGGIDVLLSARRVAPTGTAYSIPGK